MSNDDMEKKLNDMSRRLNELEDENIRLRSNLNGQQISFRRGAFVDYKSDTTILGLPLVHIRKGFNPETKEFPVAKGFIAIGDVSIGVFSLGGVAMGLFCFGGISCGLLTFGGVSLGLLLAIGGLAIGGAAFGGLAVGAIAIGGCAIGYYVNGGASFGIEALNVSEFFNSFR